MTTANTAQTQFSTNINILECKSDKLISLFLYSIVY